MSSIADTYKRISPLLRFYYKKNPGSLYPFLFLYLAREGKLLVEDRKRHIEYKSEDERLKGNVLSQFTAEDADSLARTDNAGRHLLDRWETSDLAQLSIVAPGVKDDPYLQEIRETIQKHDEELITTMEQRHALFLLAQGLIALGRDTLRNDYLSIFSIILNISGIWGENINISYLESILAEDATLSGGLAYHPFSNVPFLPAFLKELDFITEVSGPMAERNEALTRLLQIDCDNSTVAVVEKALDCKETYLEDGRKYSLVVCNYTSKSNKNETTSHYVLKYVKDLLDDSGLFIGVMNIKDYFDLATRTGLFRDLADLGCLKRVILLPKIFEKVIVEVTGKASASPFIKLVNLFNINLPSAFYDEKEYIGFLERNTSLITCLDLKNRNYSIGDFFRYKVEPKEGFKLFKLSSLISRIEKCASSIGDQDSFHTDYEYVPGAGDEYSPFHPEACGYPCSDLGIYEPNYLLEDDALLVNKEGELKPRIYGYDATPAIFRDGFAFKVKNNTYDRYLVNELRKPYVKGQLSDWKSNPQGKHSEEEILSLLIHCPVDDRGRISYETETSICKRELDENVLPAGMEIEAEDGTIYTIEEKLGNGFFGISYKATRSDRFGIGCETVVLKEFFVRIGQMTQRKGVFTQHSIGTVQSIKNHCDEAAEKYRFIEEAERMMRFGSIPDSHIRNARNIFSCKKTNNIYYETDYTQGTLEDSIEKFGVYSEEDALSQIIIPLCKAVNVLHQGRCLHRDIKPENILIDANDEAMLGDLGISKMYGADGYELSYGEKCSNSDYAPGDAFDDHYFCPEVDIYAVGKIFVYALTGTPYERNLSGCNITPESLNAIEYALDGIRRNEVHSIMRFVHMLPGCEDLEFMNDVNFQEPEIMELEPISDGELDFLNSQYYTDPTIL